MSDTQAEDQPRLRLFSAHGSSCCQRLWIALAHKKLTYTVVPVDLQNRGNQSQDYRSINSSGRVPTLEVDSEWSRRAVVLDLVALILADTQPVQNSRVCRRAGELVVGQDGDSASISEHGKRWRAVAVRDGLQAFDSMIGDGVAGRFSVGDEFTLADVVLFCQAYWAKHVSIDVVAEFPNIARVWPNILSHPSIVEGGDEKKQPDHPDKLVLH